MDTLKIEKKAIQMIAHRGLSSVERENTIPAFVAALNRSYWGIECDIHLTEDKQFVVIHDEDTYRVSGIKKKVRSSSLAELKQIPLYEIDTMVPKDYLRIPTLEEVILLCKKYQKKALVEVKDSLTEEEALLLLDLIKKTDYEEGLILISFQLETLILLRRLHKTISMQLLAGTFDQSIVEICRKHQLDLDIYHGVITMDTVRLCQKYHIKTNVWTVNNPIVALMLVEYEIDYLTTDILE
ncbi:MAG: glycerophosphodiester phosphodiesterase family protein [Bacilli bacterium]|nr:glycerophosphodiester phosphodiesterase family protein [Bacilli bacterium]